MCLRCCLSRVSLRSVRQMRSEGLNGLRGDNFSREGGRGQIFQPLLVIPRRQTGDQDVRRILDLQAVEQRQPADADEALLSRLEHKGLIGQVAHRFGKIDIAGIRQNRLGFENHVFV